MTRAARWLTMVLLRMATAVLASVAVGSVAPASAALPSAASGGSWKVVLAAGDDAQPVFDDATHALEKRLRAVNVPPANIHRLSASTAELHDGVEAATAENLLRRIASLAAGPADRCFIFLTSHGQHNGGLWLAPSQRAWRRRRTGATRWSMSVWAIINTKTYWAHLDVLKENDQRDILKKK